MPTTILSAGSTSSIVGPSAAPASGRGVIVQLGKVTGVNLNSTGNTTIFTTPASGFTRCIVTHIVVNNFSALATTASLAFGQTAAGNDWSVTGTMQGADTPRIHYRAANNSTSWTNFYGTNVTFVVNVTIAQGSACTADITAWGYYE